MFVAATSRCFPDLPLDAALQQLVDLEYSYVELMIHETDGHMKPSDVLADLGAGRDALPPDAPPDAWRLQRRYRDARRRLYYHQFAACCKLAKAIKVVTITVRSSELGTPFNAEIERLRTMVALASHESVRVGLLTEVGRMTQDPDTAVVFCDNVKGLGITLDPSHYVFGPHAGANYEQLMKHVYHVRLRDTTKRACRSASARAKSSTAGWSTS